MTAHENDEREVEIEDWLVINWEDGKTRTRKSEPGPGDLGPRELATQLQVNITIPQVDVPILQADVEVPAPKVEATALEDVDADDVPGWRNVATEVVDDARDVELTDECINRLTIEVLDETSERPPAVDVRNFVAELIKAHQDDDRRLAEVGPQP